MGILYVSDRYIDAFCCRVPKSILARNSTDYTPDRLKAIYEEADLKFKLKFGIPNSFLFLSELTPQPYCHQKD
jgi:hypothetical protein